MTAHHVRCVTIKLQKGTFNLVIVYVYMDILKIMMEDAKVNDD